MMSAPAPVTPSIAVRINAERVALLGWSRAILLQLAHPLIAAGVDEHSSFRGGPFAAAARLHHTVRAMLSLTFGSEASREDTLEHIRGIHRRVHGHLREAAGRFPAGTRYSAEDPDLVLWVHATLLDSLPLIYERVVTSLSPADLDAYCEESAPLATALGARAADVPRTWRELRAYFDPMIASDAIVVSRQARRLAHAVLAPPLRSGIPAPVAWMNRVVTLALLPPRVRDQFEFANGHAAGRPASTVLRMMAACRRVTPDRLALWPEARSSMTE
jgi:uncharacterized protein (DUF2236 family)